MSKVALVSFACLVLSATSSAKLFVRFQPDQRLSNAVVIFTSTESGVRSLRCLELGAIEGVYEGEIARTWTVDATAPVVCFATAGTDHMVFSMNDSAAKYASKKGYDYYFARTDDKGNVVGPPTISESDLYDAVSKGNLDVMRSFYGEHLADWSNVPGAKNTLMEFSEGAPIGSFQYQAVPEPTTLAGLTLSAFALARRRRGA